MHAAFGFPLRSPRGVVGVMEFFAGGLREPDERLTLRLAGLSTTVRTTDSSATGTIVNDD
mgnify:CR=1 FL=1